SLNKQHTGRCAIHDVYAQRRANLCQVGVRRCSPAREAQDKAAHLSSSCTIPQRSLHASLSSQILRPVSAFIFRPASATKLLAAANKRARLSPARNVPSAAPEVEAIDCCRRAMGLRMGCPLHESQDGTSSSALANDDSPIANALGQSNSVARG